MFFHDEEIKTAGGADGLRDRGALESAVGAPQATLDGIYLMDLFEMAATYAHSIAMNHPFIDDDKRTAAASALTFMYLNGFALCEGHSEELADMILALTTKEISKHELAQYFKEHAEPLLET